MGLHCEAHILLLLNKMIQRYSDKMISFMAATQSPFLLNFSQSHSLSSLKLEFQPQLVIKRGSPCFGSFNNGGLLRNRIGDSDGVIIVDHGSRRRESNLMLEEFVKMFREKTGYSIVEPAHMELAEPSIKTAFSLCVQQGAKRVVVNPFFLSPGRHWHQDIPSLTADAAKEFSGISYLVTAPLGLHNLLIDVVNDRIQHCLSHVEGDADECPVCVGTNKCKLYNSS